MYKLWIFELGILYLFLLGVYSCASDDSESDWGDDENKQTLLADTWYRQTKKIYYTSGADASTCFEIEEILNDLKIFPPNSILSINPKGNFTLTSYVDQTMLTSGSYTANNQTISLDYQKGTLFVNHISGDYTVDQDHLTLTFGKEAIVGYVKYNPEGVELLTFQTDTILFTYTFNKTPFSSQNLFAGSYTGTLLFSKETLNPIKNFNIQLDNSSGNLYSLSFDTFPYADTTITLKDIPVQGSQRNGILTFSVTNKEIQISGQHLLLSLSGSIENKKLQIPEMEILGGSLGKLLLRFE